jgi:type I restriction enzyme S subunit
MATLQSYKKYKSVDLNFAKQIPIDWTLKRGKFFFKEISERSKKGEEQLLSVSEHKGIVPRDSINVTMFQALSYEGYKLCNKGDIVINSLWAWHRGLGVSEHHGIVSTAYGVYRPLRPEQWNHRYLNYLIRDKTYVGECLIRSKGIWESRYLLSGRNFLDIPILQPPLEVQNGIVAYLDKKNSEIDKFIRNKEMLLELLEESRKRKIFDAITKGIDKDVDLKESGLPWIGIIPKHWELKKVKSFASHVQRGSSPTYVNESELVVISQASMSSGFIDETKYKYQSKAKIENFKGRLFEDDVLLASTGGGVLGKSIVFDRDGNYIADGHLTIIRDKKKRFNSKFLFYFLSINFDFIEGYLGQGSTNQTELQRGWFRDLYLPFPYLKEQDRIVEFVNDFNDEINLAISKAQKEISSIKEYREALITNLVTGKRSLNCDLE